MTPVTRDATMRPTRVWRDAARGAVVGVAVLLAATYFSEWWWPAVRGSAPDVYEMLARHTSIPNWLLAGLVGIALVFTATVIGSLVSRRPRWRSYTEDEFFGLVWRWRYSVVVGEGIPVDLTPFCPFCDLQVQPVLAAGGHDGIACLCDGCGRTLGTFQESAFALQRNVERLIHRRIRRHA